MSLEQFESQMPCELFHVFSTCLCYEFFMLVEAHCIVVSQPRPQEGEKPWERGWWLARRTFDLTLGRSEGTVVRGQVGLFIVVLFP